MVLLITRMATTKVTRWCSGFRTLARRMLCFVAQAQSSVLSEEREEIARDTRSVFRKTTVEWS